VTRSESPFLVGIDLGTTNSAVAFVDTRRTGRVQLFRIPQLTAPGLVEQYPVLPSFLFFPEAHELESGALSTPWTPRPDAIVGVLARERGALAPARHVSSAKSWLAHPAVDRRAAILPWGETADPRISPVEASARYLKHIRDSWNATVASNDAACRLELQTVVLTVPASFDEEARELTVEAARDAQFANLTLIEEPIAAFYAWMAAQHRPGRRRERLEDGQVALVCDVGGGTSDFSLIRVCTAATTSAGQVSFERIAIGDHLLLGGDNVDLALATLAEQRLAESRPNLKLAITQRSALRRLCSAAKERLLGDEPPDRVTVTLLGAGHRVVGAAMTTDLSRGDVERIIDDFLPVATGDGIAIPRDRRGGLRELGLPFESDPAITRHLAGFLARSSPAASENVQTVGDRRMVRPDVVLFNGGFFTPTIARERIVHALGGWFGAPPRVLTTGSLDAAVALGAAVYGRLRAAVGPSLSFVKAGSGHAYYIGLRAPDAAHATPAVCVLARGTDEGTNARIDHPFTVMTNRPVSFALYSSPIRSDRAGDLVTLALDEHVREHAPLVTVLRYGRKSRQVELPVTLSVALTEVGTLELWCEAKGSDHRWRLQFQLRGADDAIATDDGDDADVTASTNTSAVDAVISEDAIAEGERAIRAVFERTASEVTAETLVAHLEQVLGFGKTAWPLPVIRRFADVLLAVAAERRKSAALEARWLNLFGFCLRPGFGAAKDPWRISGARTVYAAGLAFSGAVQNRAEWLVLWGRVAGGFSAGQQRELAHRVIGDLGLSGKKAPRLHPQEERESWRLVASLERLDVAMRTKIGDELVRRVRRAATDASLLWAIGRVGARTPLYGPLSSVVLPQDAARWLDALVSVKITSPDLIAAIVQLAGVTGDSLRDVDERERQRAAARLRDAGAADEALRTLEQPVIRSAVDASRVFGEPLPSGLRLAIDQD
jgi:DNA-K related protein/Hsp70 protein